jgi:hypothetical protein
VIPPSQTSALWGSTVHSLNRGKLTFACGSRTPSSGKFNCKTSALSSASCHFLRSTASRSFSSARSRSRSSSHEAVDASTSLSAARLMRETERSSESAASDPSISGGAARPFPFLPLLPSAPPPPVSSALRLAARSRSIAASHAEESTSRIASPSGPGLTRSRAVSPRREARSGDARWFKR